MPTMIQKNTKSLVVKCLAAILSAFSAYSQNMLTNGDFESGGNGVGFSINSCCYNAVTPSGNTTPGNYAVTSNPFPMNTANFINSTDHSGTGNMLIVDGTTTGGQQRFWRAGNNGGGACGLTVGVTYTFSFWIRSVSSTVINVATQAAIGIAWNNANNITLTSTNTVIGGNVLAPLPAVGWQQVVYTFVPTNACVNIEMYDNNTSASGNDFAVDDFSLIGPTVPLALTYSLTHPRCPNTATGSITGYASGGTAPYTYTLTGASSGSNTNGLFTGLAGGIYSLSVTDNVGATLPASGTITLINPANITATATPSTICLGSTTRLESTGSSWPYSWTAVPADSSLTTPGISNPTVQPTQSTTYTVTSTNPTPLNLAYNGDFSLGNVGFFSDYKYYGPSNPSLVQKAYGVVAVANSWESGFSPCTGRSGSGNMLIADGSTVNGGNDRLWVQTIPVTPATNYTFRYWVQTVSSSNPANIAATINGVTLGTDLAPAAACGWVQRSYIWNSGASTSAQIILYDRNTASAGNDFAIDDIEFNTTQCTLQNSVSVTVLAVIPRPTATLVYYCQGSASQPLTVTGVVAGATVVWYSSASGGTPLAGAPNTVTTTPGAFSYWASQRVGICESARVEVEYIVTANPATPQNLVLSCDPTSTTAPNSVYFNWNNTIPGFISYNYSYSINGGPPVTGNTVASHVEVFGVLQGQSVTLTITSIVGLPCVGPQVWTCSRACPTTNAGNLSGTQNICNTTANTQFTASVAGGTWSSSNTSIATVDATGLVTPGGTLGTATINYAVAGVTGCPGATATRTITVASPPVITGIVASGPDPICINNTTFKYTATPTGGTWFSLNTAIATINATTGLVTPVTAGTVTFRYRLPGAGGCADVTADKTLIITPLPNAGTLSGIQNICRGTTTLFSPTIAGGSWSSSNAAIASITVSGNDAIITGVAVGTATVTYTVTQTIGQPCTNTVTRSVTVTAPPDAGSLSGIQNMCIGQNNIRFTSTLPGGLWTTSDALIATIDANGNIIGRSAGTATMTYTATGTGGCPDDKETRTITVTAPPNAGAINGSTTVCQGLNTLFTSSPGRGIWSSSNASIATVDATGVVTGVAVGNATINYTIAGSGGCPGDTETKAITVTPKITPTFAPIAPVCNGTVLAPLPTTSLNGFSGTWSAPLSNTMSATYHFIPTAGQCADNNGEITITILPKLIPTFAGIAPQCHNDTNVPVLPLISQNGVRGTWLPAVVDLSSVGTFTYTFTPNPGECVAVNSVPISIQVLQVTNPNFPNNRHYCSGRTTIPAFDTTSPNGVEGTWNPPVIDNLQTRDYIFTPNTVLNQCATQQRITIFIDAKTIPNFPQVAPFCVNTTTPILGTVSPNGIVGTWSPAIVDNTIVGTQRYEFTPNAGQCAVGQSMDITVTPPLVPNFPEIVLCEGSTPPVLGAVSPNGITGTWLPATIDNMLVGTNPYLFTPNAGECGSAVPINVTVKQYTLNNIKGVVSHYFDDLQVITILASGPGEYYYQLDNGALQESNVFEGVAAGLHTITVYDQNDCGPSLSDPNILVIDYPRYFTPNGDGHHDTWNIEGLKNQKNSRIFIFDRYGKLIKEISPVGTGWDGTYNGDQLPATDYWFTIDYTENTVQKQFKAHFSLKR